MVTLPIVVAYLAAGVIALPVVEFIKRSAFPFEANFNKNVMFGRDKAQFPDGKPLVYKVADNLANLIVYLIVLPAWPMFVIIFIFRLFVTKTDLQ